MSSNSRNYEKQSETVVSWKKSLMFRLTLVVLLVSLCWGLAVLFSVFYIYQKRIESEYTRNAVAISKAVTSMLDGETIDHYLTIMEKDDEYEQILERLKGKQEETDALFIYISRFVGGGEIFVFDTDDDVEGHMDLGEFELWSDEDYDMLLLPRLMRGEQVEPYLYNTHWGWLLTVHEPIRRTDGSVAGYANVDVSLDRIFRERRDVFTSLGIIITAIIFISAVINSYAIRKLVISPVRTLVNGLSAYRSGAALPEDFTESKLQPQLRSGDEFTILESAIIDMELNIGTMVRDLRKAEELTKIMQDASPLCCQLWDRSPKTIDCNEAAVNLYGFSNKQEYVERFITDCSPEYQPDGIRSYEKAVMLVNKAFDEGKCVFDWMHLIPGDGTLMPAEITLVRVDYTDDYLVAGYTRDLRDINDMESKITQLETEVDKIYYDALTGIYNRRFFDENLERVIKSLSRYGSTLSLMMVDIDFFKRYNDTYGHSEGDKCLKIIAEVLSKKIARTDDFVARYGGEEFVVVLPNTNEGGARLIAEKMLDAVRNCNILHEKSDVADFVTVSIGVTSGKVIHGQTGEFYVKRADEMLYKSKQSGRNKYSFSGH